jgi:hypothetical protein
MWIVGDPTVVTASYPSLKGDFSLTVEAPGDYTLQAYFAGKKVGPALPVTVKDADIDLSKTPLKIGDEKAAAAADKADAEKAKVEAESDAKAGDQK